MEIMFDTQFMFKCLYCNATGHLAFECSNRSLYDCSYCHSQDHRTSKCPRKSYYCNEDLQESLRAVKSTLASLRESNRKFMSDFESSSRSNGESDDNTVESNSLESDIQDLEQPLQPNEQPMNVCEGELGSEVLSLGKIVSEEPMSDIHLVESPTSVNDTDFEPKIQSCDLQNVVSCETKPIEGYETIVSCEQQDYAFDQLYVEYSDKIEVDSDFVEPPPISESVPLPNGTEKIDFVLINPTMNLSSGVSLFQVFDAQLGVDSDKHSIQSFSSHQRHDSRTNRFEEGENDACLGTPIHLSPSNYPSFHHSFNIRPQKTATIHSKFFHLPSTIIN